MMRRVLALLLLTALSGCSWGQWVAGNVQYIPLTQEIRDVVSSLGGDPSRAAYAIGVVNDTGVVAIDEQQFNLMPDTAFWHEHERMHIAYNKAGTPFGDRPEDHEHWANCGAELVTGHGPPFLYEGGYDDCSPEDVARLRWVLTERLGVTFDG